jgi:hypothetical protein
MQSILSKAIVPTLKTLKTMIVPFQKNIVTNSLTNFTLGGCLASIYYFVHDYEEEDRIRAK